MRIALTPISRKISNCRSAARVLNAAPTRQDHGGCTRLESARACRSKKTVGGGKFNRADTERGFHAINGFAVLFDRGDGNAYRFGCVTLQSCGAGILNCAFVDSRPALGNLIPSTSSAATALRI